MQVSFKIISVKLMINWLDRSQIIFLDSEILCHDVSRMKRNNSLTNENISWISTKHSFVVLAQEPPLDLH